MLKSKKDKTTTTRNAPPSIISADMNILGNLISDGTVDIDGKIEGNIKAHHVTIREGGKIHGDINADIAQIYGQVHGIVKAREVHLYSSCHVEGTIMHENLSVEDGAFVDGKFKRSDKLAPSEIATFDSEEESQEETPNLLENIRLISGGAEQ